MSRAEIVACPMRRDRALDEELPSVLYSEERK